jgi:hypothetical protein
MLSILFGKNEKTVINVDNFFNHEYEDEWFEDEYVKRLVKEIDGDEVISSKCIQSPVFGQITCTELSGGVKALILMYEERDIVVWATACGDNCAKYILEIAKKQDITISLEHYMKFPKDFEDKIKIVNDNEIIDSFWMYFYKVQKYLYHADDDLIEEVIRLNRKRGVL